MANLIKKNTYTPIPEPDNSGSKTAAALFLLSALVCAAVFVMTKFSALLILGGAFLIVGIVCLFLFDSDTDFYSAKKLYGEAGERRTGSILERYLPDDYTIIQNSVIKYGEGTSEIDNIVIGKTGVFIIEVKNMKGDIYGDYESKDWLQDKTDRYGIEHRKEFYSPVKQVGTHIYRLKNYLRDNKIFTHISGAVYFMNSESNVCIKGEANDIRIFTGDTTQSMIDYILNGTADLSEKKIERIIELLN